MDPAIRHGQILTCKFSQNINIGDIIVFWKADRLVAHRVVNSYFKEGRRYYIEKGDNTLTCSNLEQSDVLAKVIAIDGQENELSIDICRYIVNYVVAKVSYAMAILRANRIVVAKKLFRKKYLLESFIGNLVCRPTAILLLRLLFRSH
jgi:hypothetical protein